MTQACQIRWLDHGHRPGTEQRFQSVSTAELIIHALARPDVAKIHREASLMIWPRCTNVRPGRHPLHAEWQLIKEMQPHFECDPSPVRVACITMGNQNQVIKPEHNVSVLVRLQIKPDMFPLPLRSSFQRDIAPPSIILSSNLSLFTKTIRCHGATRIGAGIQCQDRAIPQLN